MKSEALIKDSESQQSEMLDCARELVKKIEDGDSDAIKAKLEELTRLREAELFQELGKLTRQLHESLNNVQLDSKIAVMTEQEIPDAKQRLLHVISMTEEAAHKTMNAVDATVPVSEQIHTSAKEIHNEWKRFRSKELTVDEFRNMSRELDRFFVSIEANSQLVNTNLTEIMMAQGYQDLTGQIIRKVISLVQDVEESLVSLIRLSGKRIVEKPQDADKAKGANGFGPQVPGLDHGDSVSSQDDVDDLLSSLGF